MKTLVECFKALPKENFENLLYHLNEGTTICCGIDSHLWTDGKGGG